MSARKDISLRRDELVDIWRLGAVRQGKVVSRRLRQKFAPDFVCQHLQQKSIFRFYPSNSGVSGIVVLWKVNCSAFSAKTLNRCNNFGSWSNTVAGLGRGSPATSNSLDSAAKLLVGCASKILAPSYRKLLIHRPTHKCVRVGTEDLLIILVLFHLRIPHIAHHSATVRKVVAVSRQTRPQD